MSDATGLKRVNVSKTVKKKPLSPNNEVMHAMEHDDGEVHHDEHEGEPLEGEGPVDLDEETFEEAVKGNDIVLVNFHAPWCPWCQRLAPTWDAVAKKAHADPPEVGKGRVRIAQVDCTQHVQLCKEQHVHAFPSIRVFREGSDLVERPTGRSDHLAYIGDRTVDAISRFADALGGAEAAKSKPGADAKSHSLSATTRRQASLVGKSAPGCNLDGFIMAKKVPGSLVVTPRGASHSFHGAMLNLSHAVHSLTFGPPTSARELSASRRLLPSLDRDPFGGASFLSDEANASHEHYLQPVHYHLLPARGLSAHAYEYTRHHHSYASPADSLPEARFAFHPSPLQVTAKERPSYGFYHFITNLCAIIGGVFSVAGVIDGLFYNIHSALRKRHIGKAF